MNADPRRPDKVQRYVPAKNNANGEDLTPDYMNIMGQPTATTANAAAGDDLHQQVEPLQDAPPPANTTSANVIPTSPQYGVAIIESTTPSTQTQPAAIITNNNKDSTSTSRNNDRFKVVKIASLEPFKRGRWKCMDYVDEAPPANVTKPVVMQSQSLPQQQIQQILMQNTQFMPQNQFFPPQQPFVNNPQYFQPQSYQYVPNNVGNTANFQQSQSYAPAQPIPPPAKPFQPYPTPTQAAQAIQETNNAYADDVSNTTGVATATTNDDASKNNPVVNAIDNKIEQAMDLVKSHLMYTVREEVEVLKEKIAELMERIQQLETENNYLRSQIPKTSNQQQQQQFQPNLVNANGGSGGGQSVSATSVQQSAPDKQMN